MIHIALIDDNPTDIDIGKQYLKAYFKGRCDAANMEINVTSYMDGPSFLADFRPGDFDLILLDIYMPQMEGTDVAKEIRKLDEGVKIIFLTTSREHALEGYKVFASGYILKPVVSHKKELCPAEGLPEACSAFRQDSGVRNPPRPLQPHSLHGLQRRKKRVHPPHG